MFLREGKASGHQNYFVIRSENEGEIIPPSEELGGVREAAGGEPRGAGQAQLSVGPFHSQTFHTARDLYRLKE